MPFAIQFIVDLEVPGVPHNFFIIPGLALEGQSDELGRTRHHDMALVGLDYFACDLTVT